MLQKSYNDTPSLYLIPTPIGNLEDITIRSLKTLEMVDLILCEDTRVTGNLLHKYDIKKKLVSCHEHNETKVRESVVNHLKEGKNIGLVTDAGTPIISDPGQVIVDYVVTHGFNVIALPGATAFVPALIASGIDNTPFLFYGFLNAKDSKQKKELESLKNNKYCTIFYEAPHRLIKTLENILEVFGNRKISISREISKLYEEIHRGTLEELLKEEIVLKGEFVLVVEGNKEIEDFSFIGIIEHIKLYLDDEMSEKDAIKKVAKERKVAKSIIYKEYIDEKTRRGDR